MPSFRLLTSLPTLPHLPMPFLRRRRRAPSPYPPPSWRPVYIYPGLLRLSARRAVMLDAACPAHVYVSFPSRSAAESHDACAVCLDTYVPDRELVRRLPCAHVFHSHCILPWVMQEDRCPLCNENVLPRGGGRGREETVRGIGLEMEMGKGRAREERMSELPDVTPSTLCVAQQNGEPGDADEERVYSFVLHDQARFAHLLDR